MQYYLHCLIVLCLVCATLNFCHGKTIKKAEANLIKPPEELSPFQGKSYPYKPEENPEEKNLQRVQSTGTAQTDNSWQGKWFPYAPGEPHIPKKEEDPNSKLRNSWQGKWFPFAPGESHTYQQDGKSTKKTVKQFPIPICDDGVVSFSLGISPFYTLAESNIIWS